MPTPSPRACSSANTRCWWRPCAGSPPAASRWLKTAFMSTAGRAPRFSWQPTSALHDGAPMSKLPTLVLLAALAWPAAHAQDAATPTAASTPPADAEATEEAPRPALEPFVATYEAYNKGDRAGNATMKVVHNGGPQWRVDLGIQGNRG